MGVEAGEERQDRGVDVQHPPRPGGDEARRQHPHEPGEAEDLGAARAERRRRAPPRTPPGRRGTAGGRRRPPAARAPPPAPGRPPPGRLERTRQTSAGCAGVGHVARQRHHVRPAARDQDRRRACGSQTPRIAHARARGHDAADPAHRLARAAPSTSASASARSGATTATMPMPQLKVFSISASAIPRGSRSQAKTGGSVQASRSISAPRPSGRTRGRFSVSPPPVMCASAVHPARPQRRAAPAARRSASASSSAAPSVPAPNGAGRVPAEPRALDDPPHQAEAVGMHARSRRGRAARRPPPRPAAAPRRAPSRRPRSPRGRSRRRRTSPASRRSRRRPAPRRPRRSRRRCPRSPRPPRRPSSRPVAK